MRLKVKVQVVRRCRRDEDIAKEIFSGKISFGGEIKKLNDTRWQEKLDETIIYEKEKFQENK